MHVPDVMRKLANWLLSIPDKRGPDFIIGGAEDPYLERWWVIPRNRFFNVYLHCFHRSDDDRALHSHPWLFNVSWMLAGDYIEHTQLGTFPRRCGDIKARWGRSWHRVELVPSKMVDAGAPCWTLFITGPVVREWGFDCDGRFVHWKTFTKVGAPGEVGRGCE